MYVHLSFYYYFVIPINPIIKKSNFYLEGQGPYLVIEDFCETESDHQKNEDFAVHRTEGNPEVRAKNQINFPISIIMMKHMLV